MRVAIVVANIAPRYGGPAKAALSYAAALASAGVEVRVVTTDQDGSGRLAVPLGVPLQQPAGFELIYCGAGRLTRNRPWSPAFARAIDRAAAWADVLHVSSLYLPHNAFVQASCRRHGTPYVVRPHGTLEVYQRQFSAGPKRVYDALYGNRYLRGAAAFHFTSDSEAAAAADVIGVDRSFVVPVPVEIPDRPADPATGRTVLFLGRVAAKKRVDLLLDAWPEIRSQHPDFRLVIAGPVDADQQPVIDRARAMTGVEVRGLVSGAAKEAAFREAAVFVLPSENENFGVAVVEAMAYGLPVVTTPAVALAEQIRGIAAGEIVPVGDVQLLAAATSHLLSDPGRGRAGRGLVGARYGVDAVGCDLADRLGRVRGRHQVLSV